MKMSRSLRVLVTVFLVLMFILTACGKSSNIAGSETSTTVQSSDVKTEQTTSAESIDPMGKYDPEITLSVGRVTNSTYKFVDGESFDNNIWVTEYKDALGINIKNDFIVDESQYDSKVNVTTASGDIPDLMMVTAEQTKMLMESDLIYEYSDIFNKYATPLTKKTITSDERTFSAAKIEGKLMGIPRVFSIDSALNNVWIRSDWMKKLNLPEPKTADDFLKIAEAFKTQDPDGNNKADTYGIAFDKTLSTANLGVFGGWLNMYHAYKGIWMKDASGNLVYSSIQPEMKTALKKMAELYKNGIIDLEFSVKDSGKIAQDFVSEKAGLVIGSFWLPAWPFQDLKNKNPESDWTPYTLLSCDDKPALSQISPVVTRYYVISKKCKNPEAVTKLLNLWFENMYGSRAAEWTKLAKSDKYKDIQTFKYNVIGIDPPTMNRDAYDEIQAARAGNDESKLLLELSKTDWKNSLAYLKGDITGYSSYKIRYDENGGMAVLKKQLDSIMYNEFVGIPGPVAVEKTTSLDKLENEVFTKIVMNSVSIDEFDKFVEQWKMIGGNDVTREVNEWYVKNK